VDLSFLTLSIEVVVHAEVMKKREIEDIWLVNRI